MDAGVKLLAEPLPTTKGACHVAGTDTAPGWVGSGAENTDFSSSGCCPAARRVALDVLNLSLSLLFPTSGRSMGSLSTPLDVSLCFFSMLFVK
jgi:hypothetical protein